MTYINFGAEYWTILSLVEYNINVEQKIKNVSKYITKYINVYIVISILFNSYNIYSLLITIAAYPSFRQVVIF